METFYISADPPYYGSDTTEEEASEAARAIAKNASDAFPNVQFVVSEKTTVFMDEDLRAEVQQYVNDTWVYWI